MAIEVKGTDLNLGASRWTWGAQILSIFWNVLQVLLLYNWFFSVKVQISVCVCMFGSSHVNARQQTVPTDWTSRLTWCTGLMLLLGERLFADQRFETNPSQQTRKQNMFSFDDRHGHAKVKPIVFARATKCCQNALVLIRTNLRTLLCFWLKNVHILAFSKDVTSKHHKYVTQLYTLLYILTIVFFSSCEIKKLTSAI